MCRLLIRFIFFSCLFYCSTAAVAVSSTEVSQNIGALMNKIDQLDQDLQKKHQQQKSLDNAINDSNAAISQSNKLLSTLKAKRNLDIQQLNEINDVLPAIESTVTQTQNMVKGAIAALYQKIKVLEYNSSSLLSESNALENKRKQAYLLELLQIEQKKYQILQAKLVELSNLNTELTREVSNLSHELGITSKHQQNLLLNKKAKGVDVVH